MFKFGKQNILLSGVLNITPDSFALSESNLNLPHIELELNKLISICDVIDVGAESTAPMNKAISAAEEIDRLKRHFLPLLASNKINQTLSIDTYHIETIKWWLKETKYQNVIWNDVSGCVSHEVHELLDKFPDLKYVLSFTFIPERSLTGKHMQYVQSELDIASAFCKFIDQHLDFYAKYPARIIIDPGFGFSKTRAQNLELLKKLPSIVNESKIHFWMIGISRKSFLRNPPELNPKDGPTQIILDSVQFLTIYQMLKLINTDNTFYLRAHNPISLLGLHHLPFN